MDILAALMIYGPVVIGGLFLIIMLRGDL